MALAPKAFALLQYLARHAGRLVPKQELLSAVWPDVFVGDAVLKSTHPRSAQGAGRRFARPALHRDRPSPRLSIHGAGHARRSTPPRRPPSRPRRRVSYARSGHVNIAYQVVGSGPVDLVFVMGWVSHLEYFWNEPSFARFLTRLASMARLILFDKRGTGLSDPVPVSELPDARPADGRRAGGDGGGGQRARGAARRVGRRTAVQPVCGDLSGADRGARHDRQLRAPAAGRTTIRGAPTREERDRFCRTIIDEWGGPVGIDERAPSMADDPAFRDWWAAYLRMGASPGAAVALTRMNAEIDIRDVLPSIRVPTLVLHRTGDRCLKVEEGRYLASRIPGATFVELPGDDHLPFVGDQDAMLWAIEAFLSRPHERAAADGRARHGDRVAAEGTPADGDLLRRLFERECQFFRGRPVPSATRYLVATFDGPGRAVQCAMSVMAIARQSASRRGRACTSANSTSNCSDTPLLVAAAAMASAADVHGVIASRAVIDLLPGTGFSFADRGHVTPAGSRELNVFAVQGWWS